MNKITTRRCAVFGCDKTEEESLCLRFPEDLNEALKWKQDLKLNDYPIELLQTHFAICCNHFIPPGSLFTKEVEGLRSQGCGQKKLKSIKTDASNESVTLTSVNLSDFLQATALHPPPTGTLEQSAYSTASTNNTDICVLETHESHYGDQDDCLRFKNSPLCLLDMTTDFTVLDAPLTQENSPSPVVDESTEVLVLQSSQCNEQQGRREQCNASGTDSDVEVLLSEEVIDSDWSASAAALDDFDEHAMEHLNINDMPEHLSKLKRHDSCSTSVSVKRQESTDHDVSVEEFSESSLGSYDGLDRLQLINLIRDQSARIRQLEATVQRYRAAQQRLFNHVDALRVEFGVDGLVGSEE